MTDFGDIFFYFFLFFLNIWLTMKHFSHFLSMFEASKIREYFQGVCHHLFVPDTEIAEMVQLVFGMELLTICSLSKAGSEPKVCFGVSLRLKKSLSIDKIT